MTTNNQLQNVKMSYEVNGEAVNLTMNTVKQYLVRGQADKVTDQEVVMFMNLCKYQKLNPFLNEAYLVKFGNDAQIITGKEAFMKRAEQNDKYEGFKAGIIVLTKDGQIKKREGTFSLEDERLVGGWAEVHRNDRVMPTIAEVSMKEYSKNQSTWKSMPSTMIRKVALVQALRETFPTDLGSMYTEEESTPVRHDVTPSVDESVQQEIDQNANSEELDFVEAEVVDPFPIAEERKEEPELETKSNNNINPKTETNNPNLETVLPGF